MASVAEQLPARPGESQMSQEARRAAAQQREAIERQKQSLNLQREHILSLRTSNPGRRAALEAALEQIETRIKALE